MTAASREEMWAAIPGHSLYDASTLGRIRSWNQRGRNRHGTRAQTPRLLTIHTRKDGYQSVFLTSDKGVRNCFKAHRLILLAWIGEPPVDPINGRPAPAPRGARYSTIASTT